MSENLDTQAIEILQKNDRGGYTVPTARLYPYQWNWDSAFVALGFATFDRERAWTELEYLLEGQWANGMVPSIIFRHDDPDYFPGPSVWQTQTAHTPKPPMPSTGVSQPPILACVIRQLVDSGDSDDLQRAGELFDKTLSWHRWYQTERAANGVVATVHPWETGRDNCPDWELGLSTMQIDSELEPYQRMDTKHANPEQRPSKEQYDKFLSIVKFGRETQWNQKTLTDEGPFLMADPGIHFILLRANKDLLELARLLNKKDAVAELESFIASGERATEYFWNESIGAFTARNIKTGAFSNGFSNASVLCFFANTGSLKQQQMTIKHLERVQQQVKFLMPSWDPSAEMFDAQRYWCGPVWPQMNYLISLGLAEQGHSALAANVREDMMALIQQSGFYECFNPVTGEGCIGTDFSWTAAVWLAWASPNRQKLAA
jgi:hypothetical protein